MAVIWEAVPQASNVTPGPQHLQPFSPIQQTTLLQNEHSRWNWTESERRGEEKGVGMGRNKERMCSEAIKEKGDKERELQGKKEEEKERNETSAEEELKQKVSLLTDEVDRAKKRMEVERYKEFEKSTQEVAAEREFEQEIFRRKDELDQELKRMKMEKEGRKKKEGKRKHLDRKILRRENDLERASLVKNWKASAAELPPSTSNEKPTVAEQILEAAKRGPKHDLCEACGRKLKFCVHEECTIIGCVACFDEYFVACLVCDANFVCVQHCIKCFACEDPYCNQCHGLTCEFCEAFTCHDFCLSNRAVYCCPERKDMCEKLQSAESSGHNFSDP